MNQVGFFKTSKILKRTFWYVALVCVVLSSFGPANPANAAIPKVINFQGKLTKVSDGTNVSNGTYAFEFKLYDALTSGNLLWTETYDQANGACGKLTVTNAIFNAKLGSCNSLSGVDFTGGSLYLSVNFAPTGTSYDGEMSPRKQLVASPFAFIANGVSGDGKIDIANTGTNQATIGYDSSNKLQVNVGSTGFTTLTANGAGAGFNLVGGNVGIGTTIPNGLLNISTAATRGILLNNSTVGQSSTDGTYLTNFASGDFSIINQEAGAFNLGTNNTNYITILSGGNVGIGTTSPVEKLQITGGGILLDNSNTSGISIKDAGGTARLVVGLDASNNFSARNPATSGSAYYGLNQPSNTTGSVYFQTAGNNVMTILNGGNVGIGTTNPAQKLEVAGNIRVNDASDNQGILFANGGTDRFKIYQNGTTLYIASQSATLGQTFGFSGGTMDGTTGGHSATLFNISGTWSQAADTLYGLKLNITDTNSGAASKLLDIQKGGTSQFNVDKNGNVGVGTTTASSNVTVYNATSPTISIYRPNAGTGSPTLNLFVAGSASGNLSFDGTFKLRGGGSGTTEVADFGISSTTLYGDLNFGKTSDTAAKIINANMYGTSGGDALLLKTFDGVGALSTRFGITGKSTTANAYFTNTNIGIGTTAPGSLFAVGSTSQFTINSTGAITAATDITSSGTITFSGLTAGGVVQATAGTGVLTVGTLGASAITADSLDFTEFQDQLDLDASTDILADGSEVLSITNTGTGNSLVVNDAASDTSPFVIDATGNVGIGTTSPSAQLDVAGDVLLSGGANRSISTKAPTSSGSGYNLTLSASSALTSGTGGSVYLVPGSGAGGPGAGTIYLGNAGTWVGASVSGTLTVNNAGPNTGNALVVNAGGQNGLTIAWDNLTPYMQYGLVSARQSRFTNSSSYTFDNNFGIGTTTVSARLHSVATTEQLRLGYDASNYASLTTGSTGNLSITPSGGTTILTGAAGTANGLAAFRVTDATNATFRMSFDNTGVIQMSGHNGHVLAFGAKDGDNSAFTERMRIVTSSGNIGIGTSSPDALLELGGNRSQSAWGLNGIALQGTAATYTDSSTAVSGTATNAVFNSFGQPTLAASNTGVTTTNAATVYIAAQPTAGTNQTITNPYSLWVDNGTARFDGNVGIGTTAPGSPLDVQSTLTASNLDTTSIATFKNLLNSSSGNTSIAIDTLYGNAAAGIVFKQAGTGKWDIVSSGADLNFRDVPNSAASSLTLKSGGNVGVGTTSPNNKLHVYFSDASYATNKTGLTVENTAAGGSSAYLNFLTAGYGTAWPARIVGYSDNINGSVSTGLGFETQVDGAGSTSRAMTIYKSNVGIGTTAPGARLHITDSTAGAVIHVQNTNTSGYAGFEMRNAANNNWGAFFGYQESTDHLRFNVRTGDIRFFGNSVEVARITNAGNVGIGTTTVGSLLTVGTSGGFTVNSSGAITAATGITSSGTITFSGLTAGGVVQATAGTGVLTVGTLGASAITADALDFTEFQDQLDLDASTDILADGSEVLSITNSGTGNSLVVNDASGDTTPFVIDAGGNVGVGTSTATQKLEVNGAILVNQGTSNRTTKLTDSGLYISRTSDGSYQSSIVADGSMTYGTRNDHIFQGDGVEIVRIVQANKSVGIGTSNPDAWLELGGAKSQSAWGLNGIALQGTAATYTDSSTAGSGTATNAVFNSFGVPTLAASNTSVTTTNAANVYIAGAPAAGTNQTITNAYSLWVDDGTARFDGNVGIGTTNPAQKLDVLGSVNVSGNINTTNTGSGQTIGSSDYNGITTFKSSRNVSFYGGVDSATITAYGQFNFYSNFSSANLMTIKQDGNVGVGTTSPDAKFDVGGSSVNSSTTTNHYRNVATYNSNNSTVTGTMKITMPKSWSSTMMNITIRGYNYVAGENRADWEVVISGYNFSGGPAWHSYGAEIHGPAPFTQVRLAHDGANNVILLGTTSTTWNYPKIVITDFLASHSNITGWSAGWSIAPITDETGIASIVTPTIPTYLNNSGNLGIGTTNPSSFKLQVAGNIGPDADSTYDLGSSSKNFNNTYSRSVISGGNLQVTAGAGGGTISFAANGSGTLFNIASTGITANGGVPITLDPGSANAFTVGSAAGASRSINIHGQTTFTTGVSTGLVTAAVKAATSQTADLFQWQNSSGTALGVINVSGNVGIGTTAPGATLQVKNVTYLEDVSLRFGANTGNSVSQNGSIYNTSGQSIKLFSNTGVDFGNNSSSIVARIAGNSGDSYFNAGNVGIGTTTPAELLHVAGDIMQRNTRTRTMTRTLPTVVNDAVDIGSFTLSQGAGSLWVSITVPGSGFSVSKEYLLPIKYSQTSSTWAIAPATSSTGSYGGNDFDLDINVAGGTTSLRIRRTGGSTAGTAYIVIQQDGVSTDTFTASTSTASVSAPTAYFTSTALTQVGGNVGIGTTAPAAFLHVVSSSAAEGLRVADSGGAYLTFKGNLGSGNPGISSSSGIIHIGSVINGTGGTEYLRVRKSSSATIIQQWENNAGTALSVVDGSGNIGIGDTSPAAALTVGSGDLFQVNSSGAIAAATGITSSGTITFSGLTAGGVVQATAGTGVLTVGTLGASAITADALDFTEFQDQLDLDASTDILADGSEVLSITNSGTGNSLVVNDASGDTTPFVIDAGGNVGVGTSTASAKVDIYNTAGTATSLYVGQTTSGGYRPSLAVSSNSVALDYNGAAAPSSSPFYYDISGVTNINSGVNGVTVASNHASGKVMFNIGTSNEIARLNATGLAIGTTTPSARLQIAGNLSASAWGLNGIALQGTAATYTDSSTAGSGTATNAVFNSFGVPTLAATNASVTTTNAANVYIAGAPAAGTNQTITNAYSLWVDDGTARFDGNVGIGTSTPTALLHVKGADTSSSTKSFSVQNSSAADGFYTTNDSYSYLGKIAEVSDNTVYHDSTVAFSVSSNAKTYLGGFYDGGTARLIVKRDGNVGVGTASPISKFQVEQGSIYANAVQSDTVLTGTGSETTANLYGSDGYWGIRTATNNSYNLDVYNSGSPITAMTILQAGNVGIGTTAPVSALDVRGIASIKPSGTGVVVGLDFTNATNQNPVIRYGDTADDLGLKIYQGANLIAAFQDNGYVKATTGFQTFGGMTMGDYFVQRGTGDAGLTTPGSGVLTFGTGSITSSLFATEYGRFNASGNLGIGTTTPAYTLDVKKSINDDYVARIKNDQDDGSTDHGLLVNTQNGASNVIVAKFATGTNAANNILTLTPGGISAGVAISSTGKISAVGGSSTSTGFGFTSNDTDGGILSPADGTMTFLTDGTERVRITSAGNVGIGTTTVSEKLHVVGNGYLTGTLQVNAANTTGSASAPHIKFETDGGNGQVGLWYDPDNNGSLRLGANSTEMIRILGSNGSYTNGYTYMNGFVGIGSTTPSAKLNISGDQTWTAWGLNGIALQNSAATYTDSSTAISGTATNAAISSFGQSTLAATNTSVTTTNAFTQYIAGAPISGTNQTLTNTTALYIAGAATTDGAGGTPTNSYGLFVNPQTGATNNYAAVFASGNVGIGTTAPITALQVEYSASNSNGLTIGNYAGGLYSQIFHETGSNKLSIENKQAGGISFKEGASAITIDGMAIYGTSDFYLQHTGGFNVGIGTTTVSAKLHSLATTQQLRLGYDASNYSGFTVGSTGALTIAQTGTGGAINITPSLASGNTTTAALNLKTSTDLAAADEVFQVGDSAADFLTVLGNGNVGIGTTSPGAKLDVNGNSIAARASAAGAVGYSILYQENGVGYVGFQQRGTTSTSVAGMGSIAGLSEIISTSNGGLGVYTHSSTPLLLGTSNTERMRIDASGNIGIGTTTPASLLHMRSDTAQITFTNIANATTATIAPTSGSLIISASGAGNGILFGNSDTYIGPVTNGSMDLGSTGQSRRWRDLYLTRDAQIGGNVGIGTTAPSAFLDVYNSGDSILAADNTSDGQVRIKATGAHSQAITLTPRLVNATLFPTGGAGIGIQASSEFAIAAATGLSLSGGGTTSDLRITTAGNVGIGTTTASSLLNIGSGTPTAAASGLNFGTDTSANLYRSAAATIKTDGSLVATGSLTAAGVNSGSGLIQGTGGLTVTGTTQINTSGTASTTIGNSAGGTITLGAASGSNLILQDADWGVTGAGAATFSSITTNGIAKLGTLDWGTVGAIFGQRSMKINELANVLYQADKRFTVTGGNANLFDGNFETGQAMTSNTTNVININIANQSGVPAAGATYPDGKVYVSFYYTSNTYTAISGRVKENGVYYALTGATNISTDGGTTYKVIEFTVPSNNYMTDLELSITTDATAVTVTEIAYISSRLSGEFELPYVSKFSNSNTIFGSLKINYNSQTPTISLSSSGSSYFNAGNVGIGTTSPASILQVSNAAAPAVKVTDSDLGTGASDGLDLQMSGAEAYLWNYENGGLTLATNNTSRMYITNGGSIGIGTTTPFSGATVASSLELGTFNGASADGNLVVRGYAALGGINKAGYGAVGSNYYLDTANTLKAKNSDHVSVIDFSAGGFLFKSAGVTAANTAITLSETMRLTSTGNLGIGDTSPAAMLSVGNGDLFQVNSSGAIAAATGITSSGTINFSGLTASSVVYTDGSKNLTSTAPTSGTIGYWSRSSTTLQPATSNDVIAASSNAVSAAGVLDITASGTITSGNNAVRITANSVTTGTAINLSTSGVTTGQALSITGPTTTGVTGTGLLKVAGDVGSAGTQGILAQFLPDFSAGSATNGYGVAVVGTDSTSVANSNTNFYSNLTLTGNAAKSGYASYNAVTTSSTTADNTYAGLFSTTASGAISTGTRNTFGVFANPSSTGANTGGTTQIFGGYFVPSSTGSTTGSTVNVFGNYVQNTATLTTNGTITSYGMYVANGSMNTTGTSTQYGLYVAPQSGADNNYAAYFGGNVGIGTTTPSVSLHVVGVANAATGMQLDFDGFDGGAYNDGLYINSTDASSYFARHIKLRNGGYNTNGYMYTGDFNGLYFDSNTTNARFKFRDISGQFVTLDKADATNTVKIEQADSKNSEAIYIDAEESTTTQSLFSIESDTSNGSGADTVKFKITADGSVYSDANVYSTPADVAEMYYDVTGDLEAGELVELGTYTDQATGEQTFGVHRMENTSTRKPFGVISTKPGPVLGYDWKNPETLAKQKPVALVGRVPVKVTLENGPIKRGDQLTNSPTQPGFATKAVTRGYSIGQALEDFDGTNPEQTSILVFVDTDKYSPTVAELLQTSQSVGTQPSELLTALSNLNMQNAEVFGDIAVQGKLYVQQDLHVQGVIYAMDIHSEKITTKELCLEDVCINKNQLQQILQLLQSGASNNGNPGGQVAGESDGNGNEELTPPTTNNEGGTEETPPPAE